MKKLKEALQVVKTLRKPDYNRPIVVMVDTSPTEIGWLINQANDEGD